MSSSRSPRLTVPLLKANISALDTNKGKNNRRLHPSVKPHLAEIAMRGPRVLQSCGGAWLDESGYCVCVGPHEQMMRVVSTMHYRNVERLHEDGGSPIWC